MATFSSIKDAAAAAGREIDDVTIAVRDARRPVRSNCRRARVFGPPRPRHTCPPRQFTMGFVAGQQSAAAAAKV